jgi:hypothetical protein
MQKRIFAPLLLISVFWFTTSGCLSKNTRNDLIVEPIETIHGNLVILIQNLEGFKKGIREKSTYNVAVRFDGIPEGSEGENVSVQISLYTPENSEQVVYEGPRFTGIIIRRPKYNDWVVGRDTDIELSFANYDLVVTMTHPIDQNEFPEVLVYTGRVVSKRLEKSGWLLDLF